MRKTDKASLLIVEDHGIVALGLKTLLAENPSLGKICSVITARQAIEMSVEQHFDIYIIDVELPDMTGIDLVKSLKTLCPDAAFIFHTIHDELWTLRQMMDGGADAVVMKSDNTDELLAAINQVMAGGSYFSSNYRQACEQMEQYQTLSPREIEVLQLIADGLMTRDIAKRLFVSDNTIEFHRKRIMRKLAATNMAQLVKQGVARGYLRKR
ncbi:MAG: response regulator transcription factor [Muribaculaceae bacterium]|nr:response regulator transcription factor [Muribaculaceae bacterium]